MKKYSLAALMAVAVLAGCQDQNEVQPGSADQSAAVEQTTPIETSTATPAKEPLDTAHSARTSLDWNGLYKGSVPCDDCAGTNLLLELKMDGQYSLGRSYEDKMSATVMEEGSISWNEVGNTVEIEEFYFFVAENQLFLVDQEGQRIVDEEGNPYTLSKAVMQ